ncbi:hypothetical protein EVAR_67025_1 [Eumeta japonica]|uniref:Uncharacterized protein n=1 Tax=Eumeta variegata TaxID=151549 RepID=A0A4C1ZZ78_EUMVA|nr:hypothetical protein EVAR_67025_1 [Eumeta japonica]
MTTWDRGQQLGALPAPPGVPTRGLSLYQSHSRDSYAEEPLEGFHRIVTRCRHLHAAQAAPTQTKQMEQCRPRRRAVRQLCLPAVGTRLRATRGAPDVMYSYSDEFRKSMGSQLSRRLTGKKHTQYLYAGGFTP